MYFFLIDTCIGFIKITGARKFCPNNKFPNKSSAGLTRLDCICSNLSSESLNLLNWLDKLKKHCSFFMVSHPVHFTNIDRNFYMLRN